MQNTKRLQKNKKGFAMGYVLIIIAVFTFLGAAMLMASSGRIQTAAFPVRYVSYFYAAETGVQVIAQHIRGHANYIEDAFDMVDLTPLAYAITATDTVYTIQNPELRNALLDVFDIDAGLHASVTAAILGEVLPINAGSINPSAAGEAILGLPPGMTFLPVSMGGQIFPSLQTSEVPAAVFMPEVAGPMEWTVQLCRVEPLSILPDPDPMALPLDPNESLLFLLDDPQLRANFVLTVSAQGIGHVRPDGTTSGGVIVSGDIRFSVGPLIADVGDREINWQLTNVRER